MNFGERLKRIRQEKKLSQRELGERLGVSQQTIAQYEKAQLNPKGSTILRLAEALELDDISLLVELPASRAVMWKHRNDDMGKTFIEQFGPENFEAFLNGDSPPNPLYSSCSTHEENSDSDCSFILPFPPTDDDVLQYYNLLNDIGKSKVICYSKDILGNPEYRKKEPEE